MVRRCDVGPGSNVGNGYINSPLRRVLKCVSRISNISHASDTGEAQHPYYWRNPNLERPWGGGLVKCLSFSRITPNNPLSSPHPYLSHHLACPCPCLPL